MSLRETAQQEMQGDHRQQGREATAVVDLSCNVTGFELLVASLRRTGADRCLLPACVARAGPVQQRLHPVPSSAAT